MSSLQDPGRDVGRALGHRRSLLAVARSYHPRRARIESAMLLGVPARARLAAAAGLVAVSRPGASRAEGTDVARVARRGRNGRPRRGGAPRAGPSRAGGSSTRARGGATACGARSRAAPTCHAGRGRHAGGACPCPSRPTPGGASWAAGALPDDQLAAAILGDRRASLLYRGLAGLDEPTLAALTADLPAVRAIYQRHAGAFAAFAARFEVRDGAVAVPGGARRRRRGRSLVGASPRAAGRFLEKLLEANGGRWAFLFDSLARLDLPRQRFALGAVGPQGRPSETALLALVRRSSTASGRWWRGEGGAFARPDADAARLLSAVRLGEDGALAGPSAARGLLARGVRGRRPHVTEGWLAELRASPAGGRGAGSPARSGRTAPARVGCVSSR